MDGLLVLIILLIAYWATPFVLIIIAFIKLKSRPEKAKQLFIISAVMLTVGVGVCGALIS